MIIGTLGHVPLEFQQWFFQLTSKPHKVYNSQLYLVPYFLSLWKCVKSATTCVLSRLESTKIVLRPGLHPGPRRGVYDATVDPLVGREGDTPSPFFTQSTPLASQSRRLGSCSPRTKSYSDAAVIIISDLTAEDIWCSRRINLAKWCKNGRQWHDGTQPLETAKMLYLNLKGDYRNVLDYFSFN